MRRFGLIVSLSAGAFVGSLVTGAAGAGAVTVTLGPPVLPTATSSGAGCFGMPACDLTLSEATYPDSSVRSVAPGDGVITGWRIRGNVAGGSLALRVLRPAGSGQDTGAGTSMPAAHVDGTPNSTNLAVEAGDRIGVETSAPASVVFNQTYVAFDPSGGTYNRWNPGLADGMSAAPSGSSAGELELNADVQLDVPVISAVQPRSSATAGGETVAISGSHLAGASSVSFGAVPAASFTVNSDTQITAISPPASAPGPVDVSVTTAGGKSAAVAADKFTYTAVAGALSALRVSPSTFKLTGRKVNGRCVKQTAKNNKHKRCKRPINLHISYTLTAPAPVTFTVERLSPGRKVKGRCVKPTNKNNKHKHCTRIKNAPGSISGTGKTGTNSFTFTGKIGGHKLGPGSYQLIATTGAGSRSVKFRIAR